MKLSICFITLLVVATCVEAQQPKTESTPKTKLEAFERQSGSVIIRGFSRHGSVSGKYGGSVAVESREFTNATTGKREHGIVIEVKEGGRLEREDRSFIDYDEIDGLLKGIEYISKIQKDVTPFDHFQADYRTKGDLTVSTFSSDGGEIAAAIESGRIGSVDVIIDLASLQKLRNIILEAKEAIDKVRKTA
jgi:hypothetical protein